jgi:hypothetical protein
LDALSRCLAGYVLGHYVSLLVCATLLIFCAKQLPSLTVYAAAGVLVLSLLSMAALSEHKRWAWPLGDRAPASRARAGGEPRHARSERHTNDTVTT